MLVIKLPLPPRACSPNYHGKLRGRMAATKAYREQARLMALVHRMKRFEGRVRISATFYCGPLPGYKPLDIQNAISALKPAIDGLVDAGLVPNDSHRWVTWGDVKLLRKASEHGGKSGVELLITLDAEEHK